MIVKTKNSVYEVKEHGSEARGKFSIVKVQDLYPGGHPNIKVDGRVRWGNKLEVAVGRDMILSQRTDGSNTFWTTTVTEVLP